MFFNHTASITILIWILTTYTSIVATDKPFKALKFTFKIFNFITNFTYFTYVGLPQHTLCHFNNLGSNLWLCLANLLRFHLIPSFSQYINYNAFICEPNLTIYLSLLVFHFIKGYFHNLTFPCPHF